MSKEAFYEVLRKLHRVTMPEVQSLPKFRLLADFELPSANWCDEYESVYNIGNWYSLSAREVTKRSGAFRYRRIIRYQRTTETPQRFLDKGENLQRYDQFLEPTKLVWVGLPKASVGQFVTEPGKYRRLLSNTPLA